jgi:hypothetical protein
MFIGAGILVALVLILIVLLSSKPWESDAYKTCVAQQKNDAGQYLDSELESAIEDYCHANYG